MDLWQLSLLLAVPWICVNENNYSIFVYTQEIALHRYVYMYLLVSPQVVHPRWKGFVSA